MKRIRTKILLDHSLNSYSFYCLVAIVFVTVITSTYYTSILLMIHSSPNNFFQHLLIHNIEIIAYIIGKLLTIISIIKAHSYYNIKSNNINTLKLKTK